MFASLGRQRRVYRVPDRRPHSALSVPTNRIDHCNWFVESAAAVVVVESAAAVAVLVVAFAAVVGAAFAAVAAATMGVAVAVSAGSVSVAAAVAAFAVVAAVVHSDPMRWPLEPYAGHGGSALRPELECYLIWEATQNVV